MKIKKQKLKYTQPLKKVGDISFQKPLFLTLRLCVRKNNSFLLQIQRLNPLPFLLQTFL